MEQHPDVLILGGGVIGLTTAYFLAREGARVEVIDKGDLGQESSWAGAGIVPPGDPSRARGPYARLLATSSTAFGPFSEELRERTGIDNGYRLCGGIEVTSDPPPDELLAEWQEQGVRAEPLAPADQRRLEPLLRRDAGRAYHLPDMAQVRNPRHLRALMGACASCGVRLTPGCPALFLERQGGRVVGLVTGTGRRVADRYLVAAGAWSDALLQPLGWRPGIHPVRGQIVLLNAGAAPFRRILQEGRRYLVPRPDGRVLVGATEEHVAFDRRTTAAAVRELLDFAFLLVPELAQAAVERCWAGLRPGSPDGLPILGRLPDLDNVFVAAGHFRAGIQLSPVTGQVMTEWLLGRGPSLPLDAFRPDRPALRAEGRCGTIRL
jgi:glycine oxidase